MRTGVQMGRCMKMWRTTGDKIMNEIMNNVAFEGADGCVVRGGKVWMLLQIHGLGVGKETGSDAS